MEHWLAIPGYEGIYEASDLGRIRSVDRVACGPTGAPKRIRGVVLQQHSPERGRDTLTLWKNGVRATQLVHVLVLQTFVGPRPAGLVACHNDGNPRNNALSNLRWDTQTNNHYDSVRHGTHPHSSKTKCAAGHDYTPENTYRYNNRRVCRECQRIWARRYQAKKRTALAELHK